MLLLALPPPQSISSAANGNKYDYAIGLATTSAFGVQSALRSSTTPALMLLTVGHVRADNRGGPDNVDLLVLLSVLSLSFLLHRHRVRLQDLSVRPRPRQRRMRHVLHSDYGHTKVRNCCISMSLFSSFVIAACM